MNDEKQFKQGDMVQHKATGMLCVILDVKDKEILVRRSDYEKTTFFTFELVKVDDSFVKDRLANIRSREVQHSQSYNGMRG